MNVLLLVKPGSLRDGLDALLFTIPEVKLVTHSNDSEAAIDFCKQNNPDLIVLEIRPDDDEFLGHVAEIKALCPEGHVVALIHDINDQLPAEQAQADLVMSIGTRPATLKAAIADLASTPAETS
jgi:two-component system invasion response regulator UvrY